MSEQAKHRRDRINIIESLSCYVGAKCTCDILSYGFLPELFQLPRGRGFGYVDKNTHYLVVMNNSIFLINFAICKILYFYGASL